MEVTILLKIILAAFLGGIIGLEREFQHKEAGLRTNILISVGSALFTLLSIQMGETGHGDPGRIAAQIVTGIGFLGAGSIIQARYSVYGLTTAASIWTVAAIGMTVGMGQYTVSLWITFFVLVILTAMRLISRRIDRIRKHFVYVITIEERASVALQIRQILKEMNIKSQSARLGKGESRFDYELAFLTSDHKNKEFFEKIMILPGVIEIHWEGA